MPSMLVIGECMLELRKDSANELVRSFAGDTYNTAVYAKRFNSEIEVSFLSAVGTDPFSQDMVTTWLAEGINIDCVQYSEQHNIGIYAVDTDDQGERHFSYWRKDSAATQLMRLLKPESMAGAHFDIIYFSGISLAILTDEDKQKLLDFVFKLSRQGARVAFDPNFRPSMWASNEDAIYWIEKAYRITDIAFPGLDDHNVLFDHTDDEMIHQYLSEFCIDEQVIKCSEQGVSVFNQKDQVHHQPFEPAPQQIDSTAAGDSFAGTYLASRLKNIDIGQAIQNASKIAALVVQHPGAIIDANKMSEVKQKH